MPAQILFIWLRGLLAVALIVTGLYFLREWYQRSHAWEPVADAAQADAPPPAPGEPPRRLAFRPRIGFNAPTAFLLGGLSLLALSFGGGRFLVLATKRRGPDEPKHSRGEHEPKVDTQRIRRPDGTELHVEFYGPPNGPPVVLVHGWGADSTEWYYAKREFGSVHRLIAWDAPGCGLSKGPDNNDYSVEKMARDLDAVVELAGGRPVVLLGHSIGGMIILTYCKLFPDALGGRVRGVILAHTTYTNPVKTHSKPDLYTTLQKPVLEPLCHLMVWLSPLVRVMSWLSYHNGTTHLSTKRSGFAGTETRGQLDWVAKFTTMIPPAVLARGALGMFRYDATDTLPNVRVPALVVVGDRDPTTVPQAGKYIRDNVPQGELLTLTPAKHYGLIEHHAQFAEASAAFVAEHTGAPAEEVEAVRRQAV